MSGAAPDTARPAPLTYAAFEPGIYGFPAPKVALLPTLRWQLPHGAGASAFSLVGAGRRSRVYKRGRYALLDAYRLCGVGAEGALLAPAFHCRTMIDPAIRLGGELLLYELAPDLAPKLASLERLVAQARQPVKAMLLTHYFGFAQTVAPLKAFCDRHGIALIEDCSHALFNLRGHERLGMHARYTITSPYKLLPCEEGGLLIASEGAALPAADQNRGAGLRTELRVLLALFQRTMASRPATPLDRDIAALDRQLAAMQPDALLANNESMTPSLSTSRLYMPSEERVAGSRTARLVMRICNFDAAVRRRREHYRQWLAAVSSLPYCRPLFPALPDDCAPYMFPLLIDHPAPHFLALKKLGMPIWRWDEMAVSECPVATAYRQRLLHLPCHQALSAADMAWMLAAVTKVMRGVVAGRNTRDNPQTLQLAGRQC